MFWLVKGLNLLNKMLQHNINIAVKGQIVGTGGADDTGLSFILTSSPSQTWLNSLFDPRDARNFTLQGQDAFAFWSNSEGNYYAIMFPSNDGRNGRLMLVINIYGYMSKDGDEVINTLRKLKDNYIKNLGQPSKDVFKALLLQFDNSLIKDYTISNRTKLSSIKGYRVFLNDNELAAMFTDLHQNEYVDCKCIYFVPSDLSQLDANFKKIITPIRVMYQIVEIPENVELEPNRRSVQKGDTLTIIYKKEGCKDEKRTVRVQGTSSSEPAISYFGNSIHITDAKTLGIKFMRRIKLDFFEEGTNSRVRNVTIVNERNQKQVSDYILLPESDNRASFGIEATGYEKKQVQLSSTEISSGKAKVELKPKISQRDITIILPDGRKSSIRAKIKEGDPLSSYLEKNWGQLFISDGPTYDGGGGEKKQSWRNLIPILLCCIVAMLVLYLVFTWFNMWPFNGQKEAPSADETKIENLADTTQSHSVDATNKQADLDFMKSNDDCWDKAQLKTDDLKNLIDFIANGQIDNAINHSYKDEDKVNGYWSGVVKIVNEIRGRVSNDQQIADAFRRCKVDYSHDKVSVKKLNNELTSLKKQLDNQSPNTSNDQTSQTHQSSENRQGNNSKDDKKSSKKGKSSKSKPAVATTGSQSNKEGRPSSK